MKLKKLIPIFFLIITLPTYLFSQQPADFTIFGVVTDSSSSQLLADVVVEAINEADTTERAAAITDSSGNYTINLTVTDIQKSIGEVPAEFSLKQNYPNPFNPSTIIGFQLPKITDVQLVIYNILGQKIKTIVKQKLTAGVYTAIWDGISDAGTGVAAGIYFYRLHTNVFRKTKKMVLLDGSSGGLSNNSSSVLRKENVAGQLSKFKNLQVTIRATSLLIHTFEQKHVNVTSQNFNFDIGVNLFFGYIDPDLIIVSEPGVNGEIYISGLPFAVIDTTAGLREISSLNKRTLDVDTTGIYHFGGFPIMIMDGIVGDSIAFNYYRDSLIIGDPIELIVKHSMPPVVINSKPTNGDKDIILDGIISVNFSEPADTNTVNPNSFTLTDSLGNIIPGTIGYRNNNTGIFFDPNQSMTPYSKYTITVTTDVTDLQGLPLDTTYIATFTTGFMNMSNWTKHQGNPMLTPGLPGAWDDFVTSHSSVIFDGNEYHMWYHGRRTDPSIYYIGHATSQDGIVWYKDSLNNPVLTGGPAGSWDENYVFSPSVVYDDSVFHMWYTGVNQYIQIGYAWSSDGVVWQKYDDSTTTNILYAESDPVLIRGAAGSWDNVVVEVPAVILQGNSYIMWYRGDNNNSWSEGIGRATSFDGINWSKDTQNNPMLTPGSSATWEHDFLRLGSVVFDGTTYHLFYYAGSFYNDFRIGYAWSSDGVNLTKYDDPNTTNLPFAQSDPVLTWCPAGSWDETLVWAPWVMLDTLSSTFKMWYTGVRFASDSTGGIGYATAPLEPNSINNNNNKNVPKGFALSQNYPNPFNPKTSIEFSIPKSEYVTLKIYNLLGQEVATLMSKKLNAGNYTYSWDAGSLASGVYMYKMQTDGGFTKTKKLILIK